MYFSPLYIRHHQAQSEYPPCSFSCLVCLLVQTIKQTGGKLPPLDQTLWRKLPPPCRPASNQKVRILLTVHCLSQGKQLPPSDDQTGCFSFRLHGNLLPAPTIDQANLALLVILDALPSSKKCFGKRIFKWPFKFNPKINWMSESSHKIGINIDICECINTALYQRLMNVDNKFWYGQLLA